jgi:hypothetical protein
LGLAGNLSEFEKDFSSGVGLDLARTFLGDLMGASLDVIEENTEAGLRAAFPLGTGKIKTLAT